MERVVIMGAAGRDFHDFNAVYRGDPGTEVVAFTRAPGQNVGEAGGERVMDRYPAELAGDGYPDGIPIVPEADLERVVREEGVDRVVFAYSDVSHEHVMHAGSRAVAAGADFGVHGADAVTLDCPVPVLAVDAVRTGCGKSGVARAFADELADRGVDAAVVREPMPYGDLVERRVQRFDTMADLDAADVTIEEREEYEGHVARGHTVFAGVDYADVRDRAAAAADLLLWDGGNNELPFLAPDVHVVLADPLRAGHERRYHPGEANLRMADYVLVNKENAAGEGAVETVVANAREANPDAELLHADSVVSVPDPDRVEGARVLCVGDGPTLTHGGAERGAAAAAAERFGAAERVDPRGAAVGEVADTLDSYPHIDRALPAVGYSEEQVADLEATVRNVDADLVLSGTPHDLSRRIDVPTPVVDVSYRTEPSGWSYGGLLDRHADDLIP